MNTRGVIFVLLVAFAITVQSQSLGTCQVGRITNYDPAQFGDSCFVGASGSATNPDDIPGIAPNQAFYRAAGTSGPGCGECYEVTSNVGTHVFRVVSECPAQGNDVCQGDMVHFDIRGENAFGLVGDTKAGILWMSHKKVACPVTGNVKIHVRDSNSGYLSLIVMNNKYRVDKVEIMINNAYQAFSKNKDTAQFDISVAYTIPATLRLTSEFGEQISFSLTTSAKNQIVTGSSNFNTATTVQDNTCYYPIPPVIYDDDFNKNLQQFPTGSNWDIGSTFDVNVNSKYTPAKIGSYALSLALTNYGGYAFGVFSFVPSSYIESIRFWAKASQATNDLKIGLAFPPTNAISLTTDWQQITIPMSQFASVPNKITQFTFQSSVSTALTVYMDQIEIVLPQSIVLPPVANYGPTGGNNGPSGNNSPGSKSPTSTGAPTTGTTNGPSKATPISSNGSVVTWIGAVSVLVATLLI